MVLSTQRQTLSCGPVYSVESSGPVLSASGTGAFRVSQAGIVHAGGVAAIAVNGGCPRGAAVVSVSVTFRRLLYRFVGSCLRELTGVCIVAMSIMMSQWNTRMKAGNFRSAPEISCCLY